MSAGARIARAACIVTTALLVLGCVAPDARADAWSEVQFTSPGGRPAHGLASDAAGTPGARLLIGCESEPRDGGWKGLAIIESVAPADATARPTPREGTVETVQATVTFFGRAPVTESWQSVVRVGTRTSWPASSETLRRGLLREDATRGQPTVTIALRAAGDAPPRTLLFGVGGLAERSADIGALCGGWGADAVHRRRERGW